MKPEGATSPSVLRRVIAVLANRQPAALLMLAALGEEARQQRRRLVGQDTGSHGRVVVQARLIEQIDDTAAGTGLGVGRADTRAA